MKRFLTVCVTLVLLVGCAKESGEEVTKYDSVGEQILSSSGVVVSGYYMIDGVQELYSGQMNNDELVANTYGTKYIEGTIVDYGDGEKEYKVTTDNNALSLQVLAMLADKVDDCKVSSNLYECEFTFENQKYEETEYTAVATAVVNVDDNGKVINVRIDVDTEDIPRIICPVGEDLEKLLATKYITKLEALDAVYTFTDSTSSNSIDKVLSNSKDSIYLDSGITFEDQGVKPSILGIDFFKNEGVINTRVLKYKNINLTSGESVKMLTYLDDARSLNSAIGVEALSLFNEVNSDDCKDLGNNTLECSVETINKNDETNDFVVAKYIIKYDDNYYPIEISYDARGVFGFESELDNDIVVDMIKSSESASEIKESNTYPSEILNKVSGYINYNEGVLKFPQPME